MPGELDGVFSGYDAKARKYDKAAWAFQLGAEGVPKKDPTLQDPMCVFQLLKKHYSPLHARHGLRDHRHAEGQDRWRSTRPSPRRHAPDQVGTSCTRWAGRSTRSARRTSARSRSSSSCSATWAWPAAASTRCAARATSRARPTTACSSTSCRATCRRRRPRRTRLKDYIEAVRPRPRSRRAPTGRATATSTSPATSRRSSATHATQENEFGYHWLPKLDDGQNASWLVLFDKMHKGKYEGLLRLGQNPACSSANAGKVRKALGKLEWMVNVNLFDNETGSFWRGPGVNPEDIKTEVFLLPCVLLGREGGEHLELGPLGAVALQGGRAARRGAGRRRDHQRAAL